MEATYFSEKIGGRFMHFPAKHFLTTVLATTLVMTSMTASAGNWYNPGSWFQPAEETTTPTNTLEKVTPTASQPVEKAATETKATPKASPEKTSHGWWGKLKSKKADATQAKKPEPSEKAPATADDQAPKHLGAMLQTQRGNIVIEFYEKDAPQTVQNFKALVEKKFYDAPGMKFHRVIPGFVIQTGDPTGTGYGGSDKKIQLEVDNKLSHDGPGVVAMARGPRPDSASSQFYITLTPQKHLDGKYAIFGHVISGYDVLSKIEKDNVLYGVKLIDTSTITREEPVKTSKGLMNLFHGNNNAQQ